MSGHLDRVGRRLVACQHRGVSQNNVGQLRAARPDDISGLTSLWRILYNEAEVTSTTPWEANAEEWFARSVEDGRHARTPVIDISGQLVATAIGTILIGVPNPYCPRGRSVRLENVVTLPEHRGKGYATMLVQDLIGWGRAAHADRVDLSATPEGQRIYERLGFTVTRAPRMKLVL